MSETTENTVGTEQDPLAAAASGWEGRKFPVLAPDRICEFKITSCKKVPLKKQPTKNQLEIVFQTTQDYSDRDGGTLRSGYKVTKWITVDPLAPSGPDKKGRTYENIKDDLLELLSWCGKKDTLARDLVNNPSMIEGYVGLAKVGVREETAEFAASNVLRLVLPA